LVTVTYGQRVAYVLKALESALAEGVHHAVLIDNGSLEPVEETLRERFGDWVTVERFARNQGSAPAFKRGIQLACDSGCELVLLLDDDNQLAEGCLRKLVDARKDISQQHGDDNCMVLAYRPGHQPVERIGQTDGFLGFHINDIPGKIAKRWGMRSWVRKFGDDEKIVTLPYAPYSGLLLHKSVADRHGLPDERFVLYADDSEFSYRVTTSGGRVALVPAAVLNELETSWNVSTDRKGFIKTLATTTVDFRIYYAIRNRCYFEKVSLRAAGPVRAFNRLTFLVLLRIACVINQTERNWAALRQAIDDGENQRLGPASLPKCRFT
jgi:GT2 family glycosyltransferase